MFLSNREKNKEGLTKNKRLNDMFNDFSPVWWCALSMHFKILKPCFYMSNNGQEQRVYE